MTRYRLALGTSAAVVSAAPWADISWYEGTARSVTVSRLPKDGSTIHARLWSKKGSKWLYNDYAIPTRLVVETPAELVAPAPGDSLSATTVTFSWSPGAAVSEYRFTLGTSLEALSSAPWADLHFYQGSATSTTAYGLPKDGSMLYVRLWSKIDGRWQTRDYTLRAPLVVETAAELVAPAPASTLPQGPITFQWTAGDAVTRYRLAIGTSAAVVSASPWADLFFYEGTDTSATVSNLPKDGSTLHVRLWSKIDGRWQTADYTLQAALVAQQPAALLSPEPGSTLEAGPVTFRWSTGKDVTRYRLAVGRSFAAVSAAPWADLHFYDGTATSTTASHLPSDGSPVFVRLWSMIDGRWQTVDYTLRAAFETTARMLSPLPTSALGSFVQTFDWSAGVGVSEYMLGVGTSAEAVSSGGGDLFFASLGSATSVSVPGIPSDGSNVHVRLWSRLTTGWQFVDYVYSTSTARPEPVRMIAPVPGSRIDSRSAEFSWSAAVPADSYRLAIATDPGIFDAAPFADVHFSDGPQTAKTVENLPQDGEPLHVRLWFQVLGKWFSRDFVYDTALVVPAALVSPIPSAPLTRSDVTFQWNAGSGADSYRLALASSPEILSAAPSFDIGFYEGTDTSATFPSIPLTGADLHARLWSRFGEDWYYRDYRIATVDDVPGAGTYDRTFLHDDLRRTYRLHVPPGYADGTPLPMLIVLHGNDSNADDMQTMTGLSALADEKRFIVLYPEAAAENARFWYDGREAAYPETINEIDFIARLMDHIERTVSVDTRRVYVTGFSGGAALTNRLGVYLASRIAAIAPVAGTLAHAIARTEDVERAMPVFYTHGTEDPFAYYHDGGSQGTDRGASMTAVNLAAWWAAKGRVILNEAISTTDGVADGTRLVSHVYRNAAGRPIVVFNSVEGGGHTWPGGEPWGHESVTGPVSRELDASRAMWSFFEGFSLDSPELQPLVGYPFEWPPVWRGAANLSCQWSRRTVAWPPSELGGVGYGEDNHSTVLQWGFPAGLPEGTKIYLSGEYPYARYFDLQVSPPWDPDYAAWRGGHGAQPIAIVDQDIDPLPGNVNPYRPGVARDAANRSYLVVFELRAAPSEEWNDLNDGAVQPPYRAPGIMRIGGHRSGRYGELGPYIEMRIYAPDGLAPFAGVTPPVVHIQVPGEAPMLAPPVAELYRYPRGEDEAEHWVKMPYAPEDNPCLGSGRAAKDQELLEKREAYVASVMAEPPGDSSPIDPRTNFYRADDDTTRQFKMFGIVHHHCVMQNAQEEGLDVARETCPQSDLTLHGRGPDEPPPRNDEHTNGMDLFNSYLATTISPYPGEVMVFRGRAPVTPRTMSGERFADWDAPLRYWSLCTAKDRVVTINCVMDEDVPVAADGSFTIVIGRPEDRPANATRACGVAWLPQLARGLNILWRMKSTRVDTWPNALQNVPWHLGDLSRETYDENAVRAVMGAYFPEGRYMSRADVEALGCTAPAR